MKTVAFTILMNMGRIFFKRAFFCFYIILNKDNIYLIIADCVLFSLGLFAEMLSGLERALLWF